MTETGALVAARRAIAAAAAAPLSRKKAMLAALLVDAAIDKLFSASAEEDVLVYRAALRTRMPALAPILDLASMTRTTLVVEPVEVAVSDYPGLGVEDFMVSLYNDRTVQRVLIAGSDGTRSDVQSALAAAIQALEAEVARR